MLFLIMSIYISQKPQKITNSKVNTSIVFMGITLLGY